MLKVLFQGIDLIKNFMQMVYPVCLNYKILKSFWNNHEKQRANDKNCGKSTTNFYFKNDFYTRVHV